MAYVDVQEAKTYLSRLLDAVESGAEAEVVIVRNGKPAARLVPMPVRKKPIFAIAKGRFKLPNDFDRDNDYIADLFEGRVSE